MVVSKVFYYLGELNDSLSYALGAESLFNVSEDSDYVHTLLAKAIDEYAALRTKAAESNEVALQMDPRLEAIVERMIDKCILESKFQQAVGIALECRRLDKLEEAIMKSDNVSGMLSYCINVSLFIEERYIKESDLLALQNNLNGNESRKSETGNGSENDTHSSTSIEGFEPNRSNYQIGELNFVKDELNKDKPDNASNELIRGGPHLVARDSVQ